LRGSMRPVRQDPRRDGVGRFVDDRTFQVRFGPSQKRKGFGALTGGAHRFPLTAIGPAKTVPESPIRDSTQGVLIRGELSNRDSAFLGRSRSLKFWNNRHRPSRVERWRGGRRFLLGLYPRFPSSCPFRSCRSSVSSARHIARSVRISRTTRTCSLRVKSYVAYRAGAAFATDQRTSR
jgi:hypothetical protein